MDVRQFDIVIFGATGVTGKYVFEELARVSKAENIKYALAARNEKKLKTTIEECKKYLQSEGETIEDVSIIIADINNEDSILKMCKKTKVILNCVGPYNFYGEIMVKSCIAAGTHHLDVSVELNYLEQMQLKYHEEAVQKGIYVLESCGFSSLPCEMGLCLIKEKFQGDLNSVETYLQIQESPQGRPVNTGTFKSFIYDFSKRYKIANIRKQLNEKIFKKFPQYSHPLIKRTLVCRSKVTNRWCTLYPFDKSITIRSQLFNYNYKNERPVQINTYFMPTLANFCSTVLMGIMVFILANFNLGIYLLNTYPKLLSFGLFQEGGPTRQQMKESTFNMFYWAEGWDDKLEIDQKHAKSPNKFMKVVLSAPDAAYFTTSICMVQAGIVCLKESENMPGSGGVLTPGAAFEGTSLLKRLQKSGFEFRIMEK